MRNECVIVVPLHRSTLRESELIAIDRCVGVWGERYDIVVVCPTGSDFSQLVECYPALKTLQVKPEMMNSIASYNKMLLSSEFYELFADYNYMLIYQADCFVFEDRLTEWLERGYDYIGAPWHFELSGFTIFGHFIGAILRTLRIYHTDYFRYGEVGNGGLSLRKISAFMEHCKNRKKLSKRASEGRLNEDVYWSFCAKLSKPSASEAAHFCGDMTPTHCPDDVMSAHGWNKTAATVEFWRKRIEDSGYKL